MKNFLEKLKAQIEADPATFYSSGNTPALDALYFHYTECYCMHSNLTKQLSQNLNELLKQLPFADGDRVSCLSNELTAEHERIAFIAGLQLGVQLMMELTKNRHEVASPYRRII